MKKELLTLELRYLDSTRGEWDSTHKNKIITIGVFDTLEEAVRYQEYKNLEKE